MQRTILGIIAISLCSLTADSLRAQNLSGHRAGMRKTDYVNGQLYGPYEDHPSFHRQARHGTYVQTGGGYNAGYARGGSYFGGGYYNDGYGGLYGGYWPRFGGLSFSYGSPYGYTSFGYYNYPYYGGYYYDPYYYDNGLYGTYYSPRYNYLDYYLPPTYYPAELAYGPQAMKQFLGLDRDFALGPLKDPAPRIEARKETIEPKVTEVSWEARQKADKYLDLGDGYFQKQKFYDALLRYKLAVEAAPGYPEAQLRHGFSLIANRRYEEASEAFKRAVALDPNIVKSGFHVDLLYSDNVAARETHEEALAQAALNEPDNGELYWTLGCWLVFNGEAERSRKFFEKAKALGVAPAKF